MNNDTSLIRVNDACLVTGLSRNTLYRYMKSGRLDYTEKDGIRWVKYLSLKQFMPDHLAPSVTYQVTQNEIQELTTSVHQLTHEVTRLCDIILQSQRHASPTPVTVDITDDNVRRALKAKTAVYAILDKYSKLNQKLPPNTKLAVEAGVERGTFAKHKKQWQIDRK